MSNSTLPTLAELKSWLPRRSILIGWIVLMGVLLWSYWWQLFTIIRIWLEPDYNHCFVVPMFCVVLLWTRREMIGTWPSEGSWWCIPFFVLWMAMWLGSAYFSYQKTIPLSLVPFLAGVALFLGSWRALGWAWPSIVFLSFMVPLPGRASDFLRGPLREIGTTVSVFIIQTMGIPAVRVGPTGTVIQLEGSQLGVAEACSGLRMLMLFFAICVGAAFVMRCPLWEKIVIVVSAVPIAICANVMRITVTAVLHHMNCGELADKLFHDGAGLLMMPFAMLLLCGEIILLKKMFIDPVSGHPLAIGRSLARASNNIDS